MLTNATSFIPARKLIDASQNKKSLAWGFWLIWLLTVTSVSLFFALTLKVAPFLHMDEVLTVNLGRNILNPATEWSVAWLTELDEPVFIISYLGVVLQELAFQAFGEYGPRISGLLGGLAAATVMVGWLYSRGTKRYVAFLLGLAFLLDPLFVQAYTMGRVDGWAIAFCLGACWVLRMEVKWPEHSRSHRLRITLAGVLAAIGFFIWTSAVFLAPLIFLELVKPLEESNVLSKNIKKVLAPLVLFSVGGGVAAIILISPIAPQVYAEISNIIEAMQINTRSGLAFGQGENTFIILIRMLKFSPVLVLVAIMGAVVRRQVGIILAGLAATILMLSTVVYIHRVLYLTPYLIAAASGVFYYGQKYIKSDLISHSLKVCLLVALLFWSIGMSLLARPALALSQSTETERDLLHNAALSMVGEGSHAVLSPFEFYYAGSALGWKMYRPYKAVGEAFSADIMLRILPHVDYVIMIKPELTEDAKYHLSVSGFREQGWYHVYKEPLKKFANGKTVEDTKYLGNLWRLRSVYSIFRQPYGPYVLYKRETK